VPLVAASLVCSGQAMAKIFFARWTRVTFQGWRKCTKCSKDTSQGETCNKCGAFVCGGCATGRCATCGD
jgi:hypothetical protein